MAKMVEYTDAQTGEKYMWDEELTLRPDNVIARLNEDLVGKQLNGETAMMLSFYMEFAISTKDLEVIRKVHDKITCYFLDC